MVASAAGEHDRVQGAVELAVAAAVEAVADGLAGAAGDRGCAGEARERGFGAESAGMRPGDEELGGGDRADAVVAKQLWRELLDEDGELALK